MLLEDPGGRSGGSGGAHIGTEAVARPSFYSVYFDREEDK